MTPPSDMTDDDLCAEIMDTVRAGRSHGQWDRERLRAVSAEATKRGLLRPSGRTEQKP